VNRFIAHLLNRWYVLTVEADMQRVEQEIKEQLSTPLPVIASVRAGRADASIDAAIAAIGRAAVKSDPSGAVECIFFTAQVPSVLIRVIYT